MQKKMLLIAGLAILSITFTACSNDNDAAGKTPITTDSSAATAASKDTGLTKQTAVVYTCKMHPEVVSDKPGKCPKCGMDLVKKETVPKDSTMKGTKMDGAK